MSAQKEIQEPSMEEILTSIRRIIADEEGAKPDEKAAPDSPAKVAAEEPAEDVLELTEVVPEKDEPRAPPAAEAVDPPPGPRRNAPEPIALAVAPPPATPSKPEPIRQESAPVATPTQAPELVSNNAAEATTSAMARLARAALPEQPPAPVAMGGKSVEQLVSEMLRPMLKEWLDQNLPGIVERIVEQEVKKLARRAELL